MARRLKEGRTGFFIASGLWHKTSHPPYEDMALRVVLGVVKWGIVVYLTI